MAIKDDLRGLGFEEVYEVERGRLYELIAEQRAYRMTVAITVLGPIYGKITFDEQSSPGSPSRGAWSPLEGASLAIGEGEDVPPDSVLLRGATYLATHLALEPADEE
jgi:hypothetical protein